MDTHEILFSKASSYGYRSWFAKDTFPMSSYPLQQEKLLKAFGDALLEANNIDCIWFDGEKKMPALFKICSGNIFESLCKLNNMKELIPPYYSKYIMVVDDKDCQNAMDELAKPTFKNSGISIVCKSELLTARLG